MPTEAAGAAGVYLRGAPPAVCEGDSVQGDRGERQSLGGGGGRGFGVEDCLWRAPGHCKTIHLFLRVMVRGG